MLIGGLQKTTLIDFPGRVACTVFTLGCNFRCPFCHNRDLVTLENFKISGLQDISEQSFFEFLEKRKKIIDGVCISGGEPTLQPDLTQFCQKIKQLGLLVKLDTNGSKPEIIKSLIDKKLVDFAAMDLKTNFEHYQELINPKSEARNPKQIINSNVLNSKLISKIKKSLNLILKSGIEYEFRTTIVPGIHDKKNLFQLGKDIARAAWVPRVPQVPRVNWILQNFRAQNCLDPKFLAVKPYSDQEMKAILKSVQKVLPSAKLRGIE